MPRILAIDYGTKRSGLAVTDKLKIIATALDTVPTHGLMAYLVAYLEQEAVECIVVGRPLRMNSKETHATGPVDQFVKKLREKFPDTTVELVDERFTSSMARDAMITAGATRSQRRDKGTVDRVSAVIILQSFMERSTG